MPSNRNCAMKVAPLRIGSADVLLELADEVELTPITVQPSTARTTQRRTVQTGVMDDVADAYVTAKEIIQSIATDFSDSFADADKAGPARVTLEFGLTLSAKTGVWIITGEGSASLKVTMEWKSRERAEN